MEKGPKKLKKIKPEDYKADPLKGDGVEPKIPWSEKTLRTGFDMEFIMKMFGNNIYHNDVSAFREQYVNHLSHGAMKAQEYGFDSYVTIELDYTKRQIIITDVDGMGIPFKDFEEICINLGKSGNKDRDRPGQHGCGLFAFLKLTSKTIIETRSRVTDEHFAYIGRDGEVWEPIKNNDLKCYGTMTILTLKESVSMSKIEENIRNIGKYFDVKTLVSVKSKDTSREDTVYEIGGKGFVDQIIHDTNSDQVIHLIDEEEGIEIYIPTSRSARSDYIDLRLVRVPVKNDSFIIPRTIPLIINLTTEKIPPPLDRDSLDEKDYKRIANCVERLLTKYFNQYHFDEVAGGLTINQRLEALRKLNIMWWVYNLDGTRKYMDPLIYRTFDSLNKSQEVCIGYCQKLEDGFKADDDANIHGNMQIVTTTSHMTLLQLLDDHENNEKRTVFTVRNFSPTYLDPFVKMLAPVEEGSDCKQIIAVKIPSASSTRFDAENASNLYDLLPAATDVRKKYKVKSSPKGKALHLAKTVAITSCNKYNETYTLDKLLDKRGKGFKTVDAKQDKFLDVLKNHMTLLVYAPYSPGFDTLSWNEGNNGLYKHGIGLSENDMLEKEEKKRENPTWQNRFFIMNQQAKKRMENEFNNFYTVNELVDMILEMHWVSGKGKEGILEDIIGGHKSNERLKNPEQKYSIVWKKEDLFENEESTHILLDGIHKQTDCSFIMTLLRLYAKLGEKWTGQSEFSFYNFSTGVNAQSYGGYIEKLHPGITKYKEHDVDRTYSYQSTASGWDKGKIALYNEHIENVLPEMVNPFVKLLASFDTSYTHKEKKLKDIFSKDSDIYEKTFFEKVEPSERWKSLIKINDRAKLSVLDELTGDWISTMEKVGKSLNVTSITKTDSMIVLKFITNSRKTIESLLSNQALRMCEFEVIHGGFLFTKKV